MPQLLIVRHGQASFGTAAYDVLSELGRRQAATTAACLRAAQVPVARVISGTLARQRDTAAVIAGAHGLAASTDPGWNEYDADALLAHHSPSPQRLEHPGESAAVPTSSREFQAILELALERWVAADAAGVGTESWPGFRDRVTASLDRAAAAGTGTTVVVSSGGAIAALCVALTGGDPAGFLAFNRVTVNCAISRVIVGRGGTHLLSFNEQQHLPAEEISYR